MAYISKPHEAFCNFLMWEKNSHLNTWIFTMGNADKTQWHCTLWSGESMSDSHNYINMNTADTLCIAHFYKAAIETEWTPQNSLAAEICLGVPFIFFIIYPRLMWGCSRTKMRMLSLAIILLCNRSVLIWVQEVLYQWRVMRLRYTIGLFLNSAKKKD